MSIQSNIGSKNGPKMAPPKVKAMTYEYCDELHDSVVIRVSSSEGTENVINHEEHHATKTSNIMNLERIEAFANRSRVFYQFDIRTI